MWADAHCHLSDERVFLNRVDWIQRAEAFGISEFYLGGYNPEDWARQRILVEEFPNRVYPIFGLHPWWVASVSENECKIAVDLLKKEAAFCFGIGETGLDFFPKIPIESHPRQIRFFKNQIEIAVQSNLPLVLHVVQAHREALSILDQYSGANLRGVVHAFQADLFTASEYLKRGWTLSFGSRILFHKQKYLTETIRNTPLECMVVESDAPDQPPPGMMKGQNHSETILKVAEKISEIKDLTRDEVLIQSKNNLRRIFRTTERKKLGDKK
jgi:TatD DNase family protein